MNNQPKRITRDALVAYLLTLTVTRDDGSVLTPAEKRAAIGEAFARECAEVTARRIGEGMVA